MGITGTRGLTPWLSGKESTCSTGDIGSIPGSGRSPGGGHDNPLQYSCLENSMDRGAWQATVHRVAKSWAQLKRLNMNESVHTHKYTQGLEQRVIGSEPCNPLLWLDALKDSFIYRVLILKRGFEGSIRILTGGALWILQISLEDFSHKESGS